MATCNECLYQPICNTYASFGVTDLPASDISPCELFKNKADVVEVKHGEWIDTGDIILDTTYSGWKCSECGYIFCGDKMNYCPNCGAKMDGERKDAE